MAWFGFNPGSLVLPAARSDQTHRARFSRADLLATCHVLSLVEELFGLVTVCLARSSSSL